MRKRLIRDESGAVMALAAAALTALLLFAGMALDLGRAHLLKAYLQTAVDASALAGALQVSPMVEIAVDRWQAFADSCADPATGQPYECHSWKAVAPVRTAGTERSLLYRQGWRTVTAPECAWPYRCADTYHIVRQWQVLPSSTIGVAEATFDANATWPSVARIEQVDVRIEPSKTEVTTTATMAMPTSFLRLIGIKELRFTRRGSAVPIRL